LDIRPETVYDFGSKADFMVYLSSLIPVVHHDIRKPTVEAKGFDFKYADLVDIPYQENSLDFMTCLHVCEHIGLGRYGDAIDPDGYKKSCKELARVCRKDLIFSVPCGKEKTVFNCHRVLNPDKVLSDFPGMELVRFGCVTSGGTLYDDCATGAVSRDKYGVGLFHFRKV
jgi:hypothetical protein